MSKIHLTVYGERPMADIQVRDKLYIDGAWVPSSGSTTIDVINSATEEVMGRVPEATPDDVDKAVQAAKRALETWSATSVEGGRKTTNGTAEVLKARTMDTAMSVPRSPACRITRSILFQPALPTW